MVFFLVESLRGFSARVSRVDWAIWLPAFLLALVSGLRLIGLGRDHQAYIVIFAKSREIPLFRMASEVGIDVGFATILNVFSRVLPSNDALWLFLITWMGLAAKFFCFRRLAPVYWVAVLVQVTFLFSFQDYTQIRVSLGLAVFMLGLTQLFTGGKLWVTLTAWLVSVSIHYTIAAMMLLGLALMISMDLFVSVAGLSLIGDRLLNVQMINDFLSNSGSQDWMRFRGYLVASEGDQLPNLLSPRKILEYVTVALFLFYRTEIRHRDWRVVEFSGWFFIAGVSIFIGFARYPVIGIRVSEMLMAFLPFLVSGLFNLLPKKLAVGYTGLVILFGLGRAGSVLDWDVMGWFKSIFSVHDSALALMAYGF